jgi:hypothetical protein
MHDHQYIANKKAALYKLLFVENNPECFRETDDLFHGKQAIVKTDLI